MWRKRYLLPSAIALIGLLLDQLSKGWVIRNIDPREIVTVIPGWFDLVHVLNRGAAFGFLNRTDMDWQRGFFIVASLVAVTLIFYLLKTLDREEPFVLWGLGLVLGGALGNLVDRVRLGVVVDFLDAHVGHYHWLAFNVADICITLGTMALIASFYQTTRQARQPRRTRPDDDV